MGKKSCRNSEKILQERKIPAGKTKNPAGIWFLTKFFGIKKIFFLGFFCMVDHYLGQINDFSLLGVYKMKNKKYFFAEKWQLQKKVAHCLL